MQVKSMIVRSGAAVAALALCTTLGCAGHGKYTTEHLNSAKEKMSMLKSGTEWQMAQQQFLAGELDKSLKTVDKSLSLNPRVAKSHLLKGRIFLEKNDMEKALACFAEAEKLDPKSAEAAYYAGIVNERINAPEAALERYRAAIERDPTNAQYVIAASEMLVLTDRTDEAWTLLEEKRSSMAYSAGILQAQGHVAILRNEPAHAVDLFKQAQLLSPDEPSIVEDLAHAEVQTGAFAEAEFHLNHLAAKYTEDGVCKRRDLQHLRARCLMNLNRPVEAREVLRALVSGDEGGRDAQSWIDLGFTGYVLRDLGTVREASARVMAIAPARHEGLLLRAMAQRLAGEREAAVRTLGQVVQSADGDTTPFVLKGALEDELGRPNDARRSYEAALRINPECQEAVALLGALDASAAVVDDGSH